MKRLLIACLSVTTLAGCMTGSSSDRLMERMAANNARAKADERARAEAELNKARAYADAERYKADAAVKKAEEDRKRAEAERDAEVNARFNRLLANYCSSTPNFRDELAVAERYFNGMRSDRFRLESPEYRIVGEYVHCLRLLSDDCKLSKAQLEDVFIGASVVGRANVLAWAHKEMDAGDKRRAVNLVSRFDPQQRSVLLLALSGQDDRTLEFIWQLHPNLRKDDTSGDVALHYAIRRGVMADVRMSLDANCVNKPGRDSRTPLYTAIDFYRHDIVSLLLENGASLRSQIRIAVDDPAMPNPSNIDMLPYDYACYKGDMKVAKMFEGKGVVPTVKDFRLAIIGGHLEMVKWFVENLHYDVNDEAIKNTAHLGSIVEAYLRERGSINQNACR